MLSITLNKETPLAQYVLKPVAISLVLAISAQINALTYPVPITMQPLALLFIGLLCSPQLAVLSVGYYLAEIAIGLPFASGFSGSLIALVSPRTGYFVGFLASVYISSKILTYKHSFAMMWVSALAGTFTLYVCGLAWLSMLMGVEKALMAGLYPFITEIPAFIAIAVISSYSIKNALPKVHQ